LIHIPRWKDELPVAERWLYLPAAGVGVLAAVLLARVPRRVAQVGGFGVLAALGATAVERTGMYRSQEALGAYTAAEYLGTKQADLNPRERYLALETGAQKHLLAGEIEAGLADLLEADRIAPALPDHLPLIAQAELDLGHPERAVEALERLLSPGFAQNPDAIRQRLDFGNDTMWRFDRVTAWHLLGRARWAAGRRAGADDAFSEAARLATGRPSEAAYLVDLSASLRASGKIDAARTALERAAALRPDWDRPRRERRALDAASGGAEAPKDRDPGER
jgi:tetratricopeptide (TPR) repeat protein